MIVNVTFKDIARRIALINRESWLVKICVIVTTRHIICVDTDGEVEFFRYPVDNTKDFYTKLYMLYQGMLNHDYYDIGQIRPNIKKRYSKKLIDLWKQANQKKSLKLSLRQQSV